MSLDSIVQITITVNNPIIDTASFGTPLLMSSEANGKFSGLTKRYSSATELLDDGFLSTGATYRFASKIKGQNPAPAEFVIGKRVTSGGKLFSYDFTVLSGNEADVYTIGINGVEYSYTRPDGYTNDQVATGLGAEIDDTNYTVSVVSDKVTVLSETPGDFPLFTYTSNISFKDNTATDADGYFTDDLNAVYGYDNSWYALLIDSNTPDDIAAGAAFVEANRRVFSYDTSDSDVYDAGSTTDIFSALQTSSYANTIGTYSRKKNQGVAAALIGKVLPYDPGTVNWAHKTLSGVDFDRLSRSVEAVIEQKNGNYYSVLGGSGNTFSGVTGSGEFIDIATSVHFLYARIQEAVAATLKGNIKIPYTNAGVSVIVSAIQGVLNSTVGGILSTDALPIVTAPRVESLSTTVKQSRHLPGIKFYGLLAGAINSVSIQGTLTLDSSVFIS